MKLIEIAGMIPGIEVRRQQFKGNEAVSITGPAKLVTYALKFALLATLVGIEQIARFGIKRDGTKVHLVLLQNPTVKLDKSQETAPIGVIEGYNYVHMATAMDGKINVGLFDEGFDANQIQPAKAFARLCDAIFTKGKVRDTDTNTLLLLGRAVKNRVLAAYRWADIEDGYANFRSLTQIEQDAKGNTRYATVQGHTVLAIGYNTGSIYALDVAQIASQFESGTTPEWQSTAVEGLRIEDVTPSIGQSQTVALTVRNDKDERQLTLAHVKWTGKGDDKQFQFVIDQQSKYATSIGRDTAPVTRLTTRTVTAVDGNGGNAPRLQIAQIDDYDPTSAQAIRNMAAAATSGRAYRTAFAAQTAL